MTTLGALIEQTRHALSGFDSQRESSAAVAYEVTTDATVIRVDDTRDAAGGIAEVDFEIMRVKDVDGQNSELVLYPFGRGYRGTSPAVHPVGTEVRFNPTWPASTVAREINGVLTEIYPAVYAIKSHETTVPVRAGIDVPTDAVGIINVYTEAATAGEWIPEHRWDWRPDGTSTGRGLHLGGHRSVGTAVRVVYAVRPKQFNLAGLLTQDFTTVTGLDARCADLVQLGVAARLAPYIDVAKLPFASAVARDAGDAKGPGSSATTVRLLTSLFRQRVEQESAVLAKEHPIRVHRTGVI